MHPTCTNFLGSLWCGILSLIKTKTSCEYTNGHPFSISLSILDKLWKVHIKKVQLTVKFRLYKYWILIWLLELNGPYIAKKQFFFVIFPVIFSYFCTILPQTENSFIKLGKNEAIPNLITTAPFFTPRATIVELTTNCRELLYRFPAVYISFLCTYFDYTIHIYNDENLSSLKSLFVAPIVLWHLLFKLGSFCFISYLNLNTVDYYIYDR